MENLLLLILPLVRRVQTRPLKPLSRHFAPQPILLDELSHMIDNQWKARSLLYVRLMCLPTLIFHSIRTKGHMRASGIHHLHSKLTSKLMKTIKVCQAKQEPAMIGNHLVVCQEKTANAFLVWPLVVKIFFIVHFLNLTYLYQPVLDADVPFL